MGAQDLRADGGMPTASGDPNDGPQASDLREQWERAKRVVTFLVQQGLEEDNPTRAAAEAQAEAAKRAWQGTQPGYSVSKRLVWAEQALARARKAQSKMEQAIDDWDQHYEAQRLQMLEQLRGLRATARERERKLAELSQEAAAEYQAPGEGRAEDRVEVAVETIEGPIRDAVQEAHDLAPEGSDLRTRLFGALGALADVSGIVASTTRRRWAEVDAADDWDDEDTWWHDGSDGHNRWDHQRGCWDDGWGGYGDGHAHDGETAMDTSDAQAPSWMRASTDDGGDPHAEGRAGKKGRWQTSGCDDQLALARGGAEATEAACQGTQVLRDQSIGAVAASSGPPAPPTPTPEEVALNQRRQAVWDQAQNEGVVVSCEQLLHMSAGELEEWAAAHLEQI